MATETKPPNPSVYTSLSSCNLYMLENQVNCDVDFIVGKKKVEKISAHKYVLMSRSPVFLVMLTGPLSGPIEVTDIEPKDFKILLRFLYADDVDLNDVSSVLPILYSSKKYMVSQLTQDCLDYLEENIFPDDVCAILEKSLLYEEPDVTEMCMSEIQMHPERVFKSAGFLSISHDALVKILQVDLYDDMEIRSLFRRCRRWAKHACEKQNLPEKPKNLRDVLGDDFFKRLEKEMSLDAVGLVFEESLFYKKKTLIKKCKSFIAENAFEMLKTDGFLNISHATLVEILRIDQINCNEAFLFLGCRRWAMSACSRKGRDSQPKDLRNTLGEALFLIMFPTIHLEDFNKFIVPTGILTAEEIGLIHAFNAAKGPQRKRFVGQKLPFPYHRKIHPDLMALAE